MASKRPRRTSPSIDNELKMTIALNRLFGEIYILAKELIIIKISDRPNPIIIQALTHIDNQYKLLIDKKKILFAKIEKNNYKIPVHVIKDGLTAVKTYETNGLSLNMAINLNISGDKAFRSPPRSSS
jgi:hypothetical protein